MTFHPFVNSGYKYGSFEVFYHEGGYDMMPEEVAKEKGIEPMQPGWYWWACFPGCLPESDPIGPFKSEEEACTAALAES